MDNGAVALPDLAHDRNIVSNPVGRFAPGLTIPAFNDLGAGYAQANNHPAMAGQILQRLRHHRAIGWWAGSQLGNTCAQPQAFGLRRDEGQRRKCIRAIGLG